MIDQGRKNVIVDKSFRFALKIVSACELLEEHKKYVISRQLLKSGTSIGANVREAQGAESKADFIHKIKIAFKEAEETEYWLQICKHSPGYPTTDELLSEIHELMNILSKIIITCKSQDTIPPFSHFPIFPFSNFQISPFSNFQISQFPHFQIFKFPN